MRGADSAHTFSNTKRKPEKNQKMDFLEVYNKSGKVTKFESSSQIFYEEKSAD